MGGAHYFPRTIKVSTPRGGTCENFDRDPRVIFLGLKFTKMSFFFGFAKLASFFWG